MFATAMGERTSAFAEIEFEPEEEEFDSMGRVQLDLTKKGNLNIAAGRLDIDFPFLSHHRRLIKQHHLAESIGYFSELRR